MDITRFDTSNSDPVWRALFDDRLDKTAARIMAVMLSRSGKHIFSCRAIGVMVGVSHVAASTSLNKLVECSYLIRKGADYYLNLKLNIPDQNIEVLSKLNESVKQTLQECKENLTDPLSKLNNNNTNNNTKNEREGNTHTFEFKSKFFGLTNEESSIGSGRLKLAGFNFLALTMPEAREAHNLLKEVKFEAVNRILLHANSMGESSESRKCLSRSFGYLTAAINDYKKSELIGQPKGGQQERPTGRPENKIFRATPKSTPNHALIKDLVQKVVGNH